MIEIFHLKTADIYILILKDIEDSCLTQLSWLFILERFDNYNQEKTCIRFRRITLPWMFRYLELGWCVTQAHIDNRPDAHCTNSAENLLLKSQQNQNYYDGLHNGLHLKQLFRSIFVKRFRTKTLNCKYMRGFFYKKFRLCKSWLAVFN